MSISNIDRNKDKIIPQTLFNKPNRSGTVYQTTKEIERKISRKITPMDEQTKSVLSRWTSLQKKIKEEITLEEISNIPINNI